MPPVPGEDVIFFTWAWGGRTQGGRVVTPLSFQYRRQAGDLSRGVTLGPMLGLAAATNPIDGGVFAGTLAWDGNAVGLEPDLSLVSVQQPHVTLMGVIWQPWLTAVAPGGQESVHVPTEALALGFPPGTLMRWILVTAREPRFDYDAFTYQDVSGGRWTSWTLDQAWLTTP
jgi:hypothetical protein